MQSGHVLQGKNTFFTCFVSSQIHDYRRVFLCPIDVTCRASWCHLPSLPCQFSMIFEYTGGWQSCFISVNKNAKKQLGQYPAMLTSRLVNNAYWKIFLKTMNVSWLITSDPCQCGFHFHFLSFFPSFLLFPSLFFCVVLTIQWKSLVSYYDYLKSFLVIF